MTSKRKAGKHKAIESKKSKLDDVVPCREFQEVVLPDFHRLTESTYQVHLSEEILSKHFNGWNFRCGNHDSQIMLLDSNGQSLLEDFWITDRERLSNGIVSNYDNSDHSIRVLCRPLKLPAPTFKKSVFSLHFENWTKHLKYRWKGYDKWSRIPGPVWYVEGEGTLQIRRKRYKVVSDIVEVTVPWEDVNAFCLPVYLSSIVVDNALLSLTMHDVSKILIRQGGKDFKVIEDGDPVDLEPGIPFDMKAVHELEDKIVKKNYGTRTIPLPYPNFNTNLFAKMEKKNANIILGLPKQDDNPSWKLNLGADGYFLFSVDTYIIHEARSVVGTFQLLELSSNLLHVVIELNVFPASFYGVQLPKTEDASLQEGAPFALRNFDLLKQIVQWIPHEEKRKIKSVCKLWSKIPLFPAVFSLSLKDGHFSEWQSPELDNVAKLLYVNP